MLFYSSDLSEKYFVKGGDNKFLGQLELLSEAIDAIGIKDDYLIQNLSDIGLDIIKALITDSKERRISFKQFLFALLDEYKARLIVKANANSSSTLGGMDFSSIKSNISSSVESFSFEYLVPIPESFTLKNGFTFTVSAVERISREKLNDLFLGNE